MIYALLRKDELNYVKLFRMIDAYVTTKPLSLNVDYEKAVFNAAKLVWPLCHIYGCFFHLSQSFLRKVQSKYLKIYKTESEFRSSYRLMQSLAFLPENDVIDVFLFLKRTTTSSFEPMLNYLEKVYIGKLKAGSKVNRVVARYPIPSWNLYNRVMKKLPRTNNAIESWHSRLKANQKNNITLNKLIDLLRTEQAKTDTAVLSIELGNRKNRPKLSIIKDENLYVLCSEYKKENLEKFLNNVSLNLRLDMVTFENSDLDSSSSD